MHETDLSEKAKRKCNRPTAEQQAKVMRFVIENRERISETALTVYELKEVIQRDLGIECTKNLLKTICNECEITLRPARKKHTRVVKGERGYVLARCLKLLIETLNSDVHDFNLPYPQELDNIASKRALNAKGPHDNLSRWERK